MCIRHKDSDLACELLLKYKISLQNLNAARSSFLPEDEKKQLVRQLHQVYGMEE